MEIDEFDEISKNRHGRVRANPLVAGPSLFVSRGLLYAAMAFLAATMATVAVATIDVVIEARGQLVVRGEPIEITAPESGRVVAVPVSVGDRVERGDVLVRLDDFEHASEARRLEAEIAHTRAEAQREREGARSIERTRAAIIAEREAIDAMIRLAEQQLRRARFLERSGVISTSRVAREEQALFDVRARRARSDAALAGVEHEMAEHRRLAATADGRIASLQIELERAREHRSRSALRAPVAGVVSRLAVRNAGRVVDALTPLVSLTPEDQPLLARIELPNRSNRGVRTGLGARIELDAYPHERFGVLSGEVVDIEPGANEAGRYWVWIRFATEPGGSPMARGLKPGLQLTSRIVVEHRGVLDLVAGPLRELSGPLTIVE